MTFSRKRTLPSPYYYSGEYEIGIRYLIDSFSVLSSLKSSVNCLKRNDKIFAPMDDYRPCLKTSFELENGHYI